MKSFSFLCVAVAVLGVVGVSLAAEPGTARPLSKIRPVAGNAGTVKTPGPARQQPATVGGLAPALPDLIINSAFVTGTVVKDGIKYKIPMMIRVRNQGAAKSSYFTVGVRYAQPVNQINPPLADYTGVAAFLTSTGSPLVVQELAAGQETWVIGFAYLPQNLAGANVKLRGQADTGGSPEHAQPWGSVKEMSENNNFSAAIGVNVPNN